MTIIDGKKISEDILNEIHLKVQERANQGLKIPHLAAILVGDDGPSETYVNSKIKACEKVGFNSSLFNYDKNISEEKLIHEIELVNNNDDIDGFIVQLPLPSSINQNNILFLLGEIYGLTYDDLSRMGLTGWNFIRKYFQDN